MTLGELSTMIQIWNRFHKTKCRNGNNANVERKAVGKAFREIRREQKNVIAENGRQWKIEKSALVLAAVHPADSCTDLADRFCLLSNVRPDHRL